MVSKKIGVLVGTYTWLGAGLIIVGVASFYADSLAGNQLLVRVVVWKLCEVLHYICMGYDLASYLYGL